jgi:hypothetical protein
MIVKFKDAAGTWQDFTAADLYSHEHALQLFSNTRIPVIIKQGINYIVNTAELFSSYKAKKAPVIMLQDWQAADFYQNIQTS